MFRLSNLKKFIKDGWCYLSCDFSVTGIENPFEEKTMWVAVEEENADMLAGNVYDPFVLLPAYLGMHYKQDVHIDGNISPRLYHNMQHYLMNIYDRYSDRTHPIQFTVNGFDTVEQVGSLISTGISCGVDSLTTIYDNFINESDPNFKINSLFFFNCGTHGDFGDEASIRKFRDRAALNKTAADELGLPMYLVNSNYHAFHLKIGRQVEAGDLAIYSCALSLQRYIKRHYLSSCYSYDEIARYSKVSRNYNIAEYCESFMLHLISTENFELVSDGCQYERPGKTERISEWGFAQRHLNVCISSKTDGAHNCCCCRKCARTLLALEAMGKLEQFKEVFDLEVWRKNSFRWKCWFRVNYGKDGMGTTLIDYAREHGMRLPPKCVAVPVKFVRHWLYQFGALK